MEADTTARNGVLRAHRRNLVRLVAVTGHAIYLAEHDAPLDDRNWFLQEYELGEPPLLLEHIRRGVEIAHADATSLLVFSGGQSRAAAGPRSEAEGYWRLANRFDWWGLNEVEQRSATEGYARDSFENLLFSICRFREWTGEYPQHVDLLSWEFKRERFDLIRGALRLLEDKFTFIGVNQPPDLAAATAGEARAVAAIALDPYGSGPEIQSKRNARNPFHLTAPYPLSCPEIQDLLSHTGPALFTGPLPWDS